MVCDCYLSCHPSVQLSPVDSWLVWYSLWMEEDPGGLNKIMGFRPGLSCYFRDKEISKKGLVAFRIVGEHRLVWLYRKSWNEIILQRTCLRSRWSNQDAVRRFKLRVSWGLSKRIRVEGIYVMFRAQLFGTGDGVPTDNKGREILFLSSPTRRMVIKLFVLYSIRWEEKGKGDREVLRTSSNFRWLIL